MIRYWNATPWVAVAVSGLVITGRAEGGRITKRRVCVAELPQLAATTLALKLPLVWGMPVINPSDRMTRLFGSPVAV